MNEQEKEIQRSILLRAFSRMIEWGNRYLTLSRWFFRGDRNIFIKIEILIVSITVFCIGILFFVDRLPLWLGLVVCLFLIQRLVEFLVIYSRNFILNRGRIFSHFHDKTVRGQWLLLMFSLNVAQLVFIFATWYRAISLRTPEAFSKSISALDSLYFSVINFLTIGYGDIVPVSAFAKITVMSQNVFTFFTVIVVVNGILSLHFRKDAVDKNKRLP